MQKNNMVIRMTEAIGNIRIERPCGDARYVLLIEPFKFYSDILKCWCVIPKGFIYDEESVPIIKGTNPEAGLIHDYLCRYDSIPIVDKETAALVYREFQKYYDSMEEDKDIEGIKDFIMDKKNRLWDWIRRNLIKTPAVILAPGYFHKLSVYATYEEVKAA